MPAQAEGTAIGFARAFDTDQESCVEGIRFGSVTSLTGAHALLFFACGLLGHGESIRAELSAGDKADLRSFWGRGLEQPESNTALRESPVNTRRSGIQLWFRQAPA